MGGYGTAIVTGGVQAAAAAGAAVAEMFKHYNGAAPA